ncbi:MAG TPA: hypothetical protein PLR71_07800, partial [Deltaproteobacteria bacterium]|nr:hypothetical protein [Deltaproteobacteria bacterium]
MTSRPGSSIIGTGRPGARSRALGLLLLILSVTAPRAGAAEPADQYELLAQATALVQEDRLEEA